MNRYAAMIMLMLAVQAFSEPATLKVPQDYHTIQEAVGAAKLGDTVAIAPGKYDGPVLLEKGITLRGEGEVIISNAAKLGRVVGVTSPENVQIENLILEHTDKEPPGNDSKAPPAILGVAGGRATVRNVTCRKSAGHGMTVRDGGNAMITGCTCTENVLCGITVQDKNSVAQITDSEVTKNGHAGVYAFQNATAELSGVTARQNGNAGIRAQEMLDGKITMCNCRILENNSSGIYLAHAAALLVKECHSMNNKRYGVELLCGAKGTITGNTFQENDMGGMFAAAILTDITVEGNDISKNKESGIYIEHAARARITNNTLTNNELSGIVVRHLDTHAEIDGNTCQDHSVLGISIYLDANGSIKNNRCVNNRSCNISVGNLTAPVDIEGNISEGSSRNEPVIYHNKVSEYAWQVNAYYTGWALIQKQYDHLERLAAWSRENIDEDNNLDSFYAGVVNGYSPEDCRARESHMPAIQGWIEKYPESTAAREALAYTYIAYAWGSRGEDKASKVTVDGWKGFKENMRRAEEVLKATELMQNPDVALYVAWLKVGLGLRYDRKAMKDLFEKGHALSPGYYMLYGQLAQSLMVRWGGSKKEMADFFKRTLELSKEGSGALVYTLLVSWNVKEFDCREVASGEIVDWSTLEQGYTELLRRYPESDRYLNQYCHMACLFGKRDLAAQLFKQIGSNFDCMAWDNGNGQYDEEQIFGKYSRWANFDNKPNPCDATMVAQQAAPPIPAAGTLAAVLPLLLGHRKWLMVAGLAVAGTAIAVVVLIIRLTVGR